MSLKKRSGGLFLHVKSGVASDFAVAAVIETELVVEIVKIFVAPNTILYFNGHYGIRSHVGRNDDERNVCGVKFTSGGLIDLLVHGVYLLHLMVLL
jgi:hypothetical protein